MKIRSLVAHLAWVACALTLHAQSPTPSPTPRRPIRAPVPVYLREWAERGLTGKGIVLVTIDSRGKVTGARMLQSTGSKLLDGSALEAFSRWRFKPGTRSEVRIPIEFTNRGAKKQET
jgi:TonB family protein